MAGYPQALIDPLLDEEMARHGEDERVKVVVIMKSQYDRSLLNRRASVYANRADRREFVVNELKEFARASQYDLKLSLSEMERNGMVSAPITLWMANALYFDATKEAVQDLARRSDIALVGLVIDHYCIPDGEVAESVFAMREITPNVTQVHADQVWEMGYKGEGIVVALVDSGVNYHHLDVADHLWDGGEEFPHHGYDVRNQDDDPMDDHGHGSHCAGIICGDGTAGSQTGLAPEATLMCVKCMSASGYCSGVNIAEGIQWAIEHGCDMFSMSMGLVFPSITERLLLRHTCESALDVGIVAAIAAGNEGEKLDQYPAPNNVRLPGSCPPPYMDDIQGENPGGLSCAVCVGAVDYDNNAASFTSQGPSDWASTEFGDYPYLPGIGLIRPDVCAPGVRIKSLNYLGNNGYINMSGTSMAAPCVAGCMALMLSKDNSLTPADICRILEETAVPLEEGKSNIYGFGLVNVLSAIEAIPLGGIRYQGYALNDFGGNNNHRLNPGESVSMSLTLNNIFDEPIGHVSAVLATDDAHVVLTNDTVVFPVFAAHETLTVNDAFSFMVADQVVAMQKIKFSVKIYVDGELMGVFKDRIVVYDYLLQLGNYTILNDDNSDGLLGPGETADMRIWVENKGNDASPFLTGTMSTNNPLLSLNETEKVFDSIAAGSECYADYHMTLDESAAMDVTIPIALNLVDADGRHFELTFDYRNTCQVIFSLYDSFGDGWQDNYLQVDYSDGTPSEQMTLNDGNTAVFVREPVHNSTITLSWHGSSWGQECSIVMTYEDGTVIFQNVGGFSETMSFTINCSNGFGIDELERLAQKVSIFPNPTSGSVTVRCPGMNQVEIYSAEGRLVKRLLVNDDVCQIDDLESGIYMIRIMENEDTLVRKLVKW